MKITKRQLRRIIAESQDQFSHVVKTSTGIFGRPMKIDEEADGNLVIVADEAEIEKFYYDLMSVFPNGEMIEDGFATGEYEDMSRAPFRESKVTKRQLRQIIKEEKQKLMHEYVDMSDPRLVSFQKALDAAFFNALQAGADISELGQVAEHFMATMGYEG